MMRSPYNACTKIKLDSTGARHIVCDPPRSRVAIIAADSSYQEAPFNSKDWEIWSCNSLWQYCQDHHGLFRADRWFEMHPLRVQTPAEMQAIYTCPIPIYLLGDDHRQAPNGVPYPLTHVHAQFPYRYFSCTFAYQIALALHEGFTTIGLYGVELEHGTAREHLAEKACVAFWLGIAAGMGVNVCVPEGNRLMQQTHLYGYDYDEEVTEVSSDVDRLFFTRLKELEVTGHVERIDYATSHDHLRGSA